MAVAEPYSAPRALRVRSLVQRPSRLEGVSWLDGLSLLLLGVVTIVALITPWIAPHKPLVPAGDPLLSPGHGGFLLGTDEIGRDMLSRVLFGLRSSWWAAAVVITSGVVVGGLVGLIAGTAGGWVDNVLMRVTDVFLALPGPVLAIAVVAALGPSFTHTLIAVAIVWWPFYARIVRGEIRGLAARPHVEAARLGGASRARVAFRHLLPGAIPATIVTASLDVGNLVLTLAALSFLGLGAPAPAPELGAMSARSLSFLLTQWWIPVIPGLGVFLLALIANLAGDGLRDLLSNR